MYMQDSNQIVTIINIIISHPDIYHVNELCIKWIYNITQFDIFCQTEGIKNG